MTTGIYARSIKPEDEAFYANLLHTFIFNGINIIVFEALEEVTKKHSPNAPIFNNYDDIVETCDYMVALGGDGTLLDTLKYIRNSNIPIIGINLGRLGFLSSIGKEDTHLMVEAMKTRSFVHDKRTLVTVQSSSPLFEDFPFALNEFTIHKKDEASMIVVNTYINGEFLNSYWCDGLLIATPTGSTAYSLSCGGPVIMPGSSSFVITPVANHNLNVRPLVLNDDSVVSFEIEGRSNNVLCTLDSRAETIDTGCQLAVRKADFTVTLFRLPDKSFLETLSVKMMWGADTRRR